VNEELFYKNQLQDLEDQKAAYFHQLDEIERMRAEIAQKKENMNAAESLISGDYEKIREAKHLIASEYEKLLIQNNELDKAINEYESKRSSFSEKENDLNSRIENFESELKKFERRKTRYDADILLFNKKEELFQEKKLKHVDSEKELNKRITDLRSCKEEIASQEIDIELENEKIESIRQSNKVMRNKLLSEENKLKSQGHELEELKIRNEKDIGTQMTLQRQNLNIKKLNSRIDQQFSYIKTLEDNVLELKLKLENSNKALDEATICTRIFEQNLELLHIN